MIPISRLTQILSIVFKLGLTLYKIAKEHRYEIYQGWQSGQREADDTFGRPMGRPEQANDGPKAEKSSGG